MTMAMHVVPEVHFNFAIAAFAQLSVCAFEGRQRGKEIVGQRERLREEKRKRMRVRDREEGEDAAMRH